MVSEFFIMIDLIQSSVNIQLRITGFWSKYFAGSNLESIHKLNQIILPLHEFDRKWRLYNN